MVGLCVVFIFSGLGHLEQGVEGVESWHLEAFALGDSDGVAEDDFEFHGTVVLPVEEHAWFSVGVSLGAFEDLGW